MPKLPEPAAVEPQLTGWRSSSDIVHVSVDCAGLERMRQAGRDPAQTLEPWPYARPADLVGEYRVSPCRLCAVEPAVLDILSEAHAGTVRSAAAPVFVTFTMSRPPEADPYSRTAQARRRNRASIDPDRMRELATEAAARLRRITDAVGLCTTTTARGAAAYGFVSGPSLDKLAVVVRTEARLTVTELPAAQQVATFWSLLAEADPDAGPEAPDPWFVAELVCADPA